MAEQMMQETAGKAIPAGYKQTEVGVIPGDWEVKVLGELVEISSGESPSKFIFTDSGIPYFKVEQLNDGLIYADETPYFIDAVKIVKAGSVIFPKRGASILLNKIRILKRDSFMDTNLMALTCSLSLDALYLYNQLIYKKLSSVADTTSIPQINNKHITPYAIPFPTKQEQTAIANVLSDSDALIDALEQLIAKKQAIKSATMQQLLTGRTRLPAFALRPDGTQKGYKPSELGEIPEDWVVIPLGDICSLYQPVTISGSELKESGYPVYGANGLIGFYEKYNHEAPQVIVTCRGSTCGTVNYTVAKSWITGNAMVVDVDKNKKLDKNFTYYMLSNQDLTVCITGSGQPQIVRSPLAAFKVVLPEIEEQTAIATILSDMDNELQALTRKLEKARALKQGMMQQLLTGKIRLPLAAGA
ncbi:restriction endonuclease subunit S [Aeromonas veronii]|uniref:restriction endonuclease subunit S n=1 Tax=Aeromonas veronii TaxID=654 RepID=UPI0015EC35C1|nr:restriction endonuclease subunit S [Aeromonas veronii]MBA2799899.1 restriction endonuclease subunit S [Aeromonas veronii]